MEVHVTIKTQKGTEEYCFDGMWERFLLGMCNQIKIVDEYHESVIRKLHNDINALLEMTPEERDYISK